HRSTGCSIDSLQLSSLIAVQVDCDGIVANKIINYEFKIFVYSYANKSQALTGPLISHEFWFQSMNFLIKSPESGDKQAQLLEESIRRGELSRGTLKPRTGR